MNWEERRAFNINYRKQKELNKIKKYREQVRKTLEKNHKTFIEKFHDGFYDEFLENYHPRWEHICDMSDYEAREFDRLYDEYIAKKKNGE